MDAKLTVQLFRVGFGDCIYVLIPDGKKTFSVLIDCGTSAAATTTLKPVVERLRAILPKDQAGKPRLDLLVVTHPHADHIKGFDPDWFAGVTIGRIWMSAFLNKDHPQAQKALAFDQAAETSARALLYERPGLNFSAGAQSLLQRCLANDDALLALREGLPTVNGRLYVARDVADRLSKAERTRQKLSTENGVTCFRGFKEPGTCLRVLAPEWDIDGTYLGKASAEGSAFVDPLLLRTEAYRGVPADGEGSLPGGEQNQIPNPPLPQPANLSPRDFRLLRSRLLYSALAFSQEDDALKNNVSVILLLEWRGRRLLFAGDAEWDGTGVQQDQRNSSWDVMLNIPEVRQVLLQPLDLFKVAHHGSINGSPFDPQGGAQLLDQMISPERTQVVVSTVVGVHGKKNPVPYAPLMIELGRLAANKRTYAEGEPALIDLPQPQRTDREALVTDKGVAYLEVSFDPVV